MYDNRREIESLLLDIAASRVCAPVPAPARISDDVVRIGVLTDMQASTPTGRAADRLSPLRWPLATSEAFRRVG